MSYRCNECEAEFSRPKQSHFVGTGGKFCPICGDGNIIEFDEAKDKKALKYYTYNRRLDRG